MQKPALKPTAEATPFWMGCSRGELRYQYCTNCCTPQFPPSVVCVHCHSDRLEWKVSSGQGTVHSFTVVWRAPTPAFKEQVPYVIALIDFEESFRMMMNVRTQQPDDIRVGTPVSVVFEEYEDTQLPQAVPRPA